MIIPYKTPITSPASPWSHPTLVAPRERHEKCNFSIRSRSSGEDAAGASPGEGPKLRQLLEFGGEDVPLIFTFKKWLMITYS